MSTSGGELHFHPGHINQGTDIAGAVVRIWPAPDPDFWHVGLAGYPPRATEAPILSDLVPELLEDGGSVRNGGPLAGAVHTVNPDLEMVRRRTERQTEWHRNDGA